MMLFLLGCSQPGVLDAISGHMADDLVVDAHDALLRSGAIGLLVGEIAMAGDPATEAFDGVGARMLGASWPTVTEGEDGSVDFLFEPVGTEGSIGTLTLNTSPAYASFQVAFVWPDGVLSGTVNVSRSTDFAAVDGVIGEVAANVEDCAVTLKGTYPYTGLSFGPWSADPVGGQLVWARETDTVELLPAETSDLSAGWPAVAGGKGWTGETVVPWP